MKTTHYKPRIAALLLVLATAFTTLPAAAQGDKSLTQLPTEWPTNGGDIYNRRFSSLQQIDVGNVQDLKGVWHVHLGGSGAGYRNSGEAQPVVVDGVIYISTGDSDIFAISVDSGEILWQYRANLKDENVTQCCGWVSRGVAVGEGKVFHGHLDNRVVALDQKTGEVIWEVQSEVVGAGFSITHAPLYYDGLVFVGYAGGEMGVRGRIRALNARDGSEVWMFNTVPDPGEFGGDTWPANSDVYQRGGANIWHTPALDPELGMMYFSTSNAAPGSEGWLRPGDNLFSVSILALDYRTGAYRWHFQEVHHDIWDYDAANPVILFDAEYRGQSRKALVQAGKTGWLYILDRVTGEPLLGVEERPVPQEPRMATAATQPYPVGEAFVPQSLDIAPEGYQLVNKAAVFTPFYDEPTLFTPGFVGGANWPPSAVDPASKTMFICAADRPVVVRASLDGKPSYPVFPKPDMGVIAAMDLTTNRIEWRQHINELCWSGVTATAGGLIFVGRSDGRLTALESSNGRKLWEFQTGAGMNAPVSVFEHEGTEYVVAYSAGNLLGGTEHGDSVWLFSLKGTLDTLPIAPPPFFVPQPPTEEELAARQRIIEPAQGAADLDNGLRSYRSICSACHGEDGRGGHGGGADLATIRDTAAIVKAINYGGDKMPAIGAAFTPESLRDVAAYVTEVLAARAGE
ncbi:MAG: PQQ-binding-like beta-propeller repeat protein [Gammaproteobacteria bacterium]|nr:PQQ-binding-like beta-propeller repeat protein [Gammaproteobacteria bacterium]